MKMVMAFDKRMYIGRGYECMRLTKKLERSHTAYMQSFQKIHIDDGRLYGIYIESSGYYRSKPTIILLESDVVADILADWYGEEV